MADRRRKAQIKHPPNPSFDEGYALLVRALGHLTATASGHARKQTAISAAIHHLYTAEELLKPYRGGYGDGKKAA